MYSRNQYKIIKKIKKIQEADFHADDIELLLINIREYARQNNNQILLEICDFVAHPERDRGIIWEKI